MIFLTVAESTPDGPAATAVESAEPDARLPRPMMIVRHGLPHLVEATVIPAVLFLVVLHFSSFTLAALAALVWEYAAVSRRVAMRRRIPALLVLSSIGLTVRTAVAIMNGSAFIYFLQPVIVAGVVGLMFLLSALSPRPLVHRLARDFCPLPHGVTGRPGVRRLFLGLTLLWAAVNLGNSAFTYWLLTSQTTEVFVAVRGITSTALPVTATLITIAWSWRVAGQEGLRATPAV
ncbi:septation protein IspZ [Frankia sp. CNm7]|uniref:Septation protein IspZ n=1 Tax=Frankia nepalensis TaxID=1836974 RepID=A0A937UQ13_9ACTN|nr:VC0807 family protein [Frankia nepalensis]MBL7496907.1 septation protein IspZ [Frankia nepalensis]MBL7508332.1 septation protein IspZ [Frankia nepalensis]MBL7524564.1 septation protein IspZ [Frankia nepalensis]MBL7626161.1 septation protein IspZ [Frankia nepalensis]